MILAIAIISGIVVFGHLAFILLHERETTGEIQPGDSTVSAVIGLMWILAWIVVFAMSLVEIMLRATNHWG